MSLLVLEDLRYSPFEGSVDPSLPIGYWQCSVNSIGDGSMGDHILGHTLVPSAQADPSLWSLEQIGYQRDAADAFVVMLEIDGQDNPNDPATPITSSFELGALDTPPSARQAPVGRDLAFLPYFIGPSAGREASRALVIFLVVTNVINVAFRTMLRGYRWGGRALSTPTGPRVPPGGVFRG